MRVAHPSIATGLVNSVGELTGGANVSCAAKLERSLTKTSGTSGGKKKSSAATKRKAEKKARSTGATKIESGFRSLIGSPLFRNAVAAGLVAAAAALVSKASGSSNDLSPEAPGRDERGDGASLAAAPPSLTSKVKRKAKTATTAVSKAAESIALEDAAARVSGKAKKAAKAAKAALTSADDYSQVTRSDESTEPQPQRRTRKVRSDAGTPRKPKVHVAVMGEPQTGDLPILSTTETSALALSTATTPNDDEPRSLEEQSAEAHPRQI